MCYLQGCAAIPRKSPERMHWCCLRDYVCMLWLCLTWFGVYFGWGLCAWQLTYSTLFSQMLAAHKSCRSPLTSGDHIRGCIALKTTAQLTIHKASHYSKISLWDNHNAVGHQQTASGGLLQVQQGSWLWKSWTGQHVSGFVGRKFTWVQKFAYVLKDQEQHQVTLLQAVSYIAHACSPDSNWPGTMQVEMLVHAEASKNIRRGTLVGWLANSVEQLEA